MMQLNPEDFTSSGQEGGDETSGHDTINPPPHSVTGNTGDYLALMQIYHTLQVAWYLTNLRYLCVPEAHVRI